MKKKLGNFFFIILFFFIFSSSSKTFANSAYCELLVEKLVNSPKEHKWEVVYPDEILNDFGFTLLFDVDGKTNKTKYRKDSTGNFLIGKIHDLSLAKSVITGDSIISLNNKKFENSQDLYNLIENEDKIDISILKNDNQIVNLNLNKKKYFITNEFFQIEDISINSIDQKRGTFEIRFNHNFAKLFNKNTFENFYNIVEDTIIFQNSNGTWSLEVCIYSDTEFEDSKIVEPGYEVKLLDISKKNRNYLSENFKITPYSKTKLNNPLDAAYIQKNIEGIYELKNKFNLKAFPFDKQRLSVKLIDGRFNLDQRNIFVSENTHAFLQDYVDKNEVLGWNITGYEINDFQYQNSFHMKKDFSDGLSLDFIIERKHGYYIFKIVIPIILILLICWGSVWIDPKEIESRLTITIVCLLSLIAYNFVIDSELPKLEYLTVMDWIILISYVYATIPNFLSIISFKLVKINISLCNRVESISKKYGILSYVLIIFFIIVVNANLNPENSSALISWMAGR